MVEKLANLCKKKLAKKFHLNAFIVGLFLSSSGPCHSQHTTKVHKKPSKRSSKSSLSWIERERERDSETETEKECLRLMKFLTC